VGASNTAIKKKVGAHSKEVSKNSGAKVFDNTQPVIPKKEPKEFQKSTIEKSKLSNYNPVSIAETNTEAITRSPRCADTKCEPSTKEDAVQSCLPSGTFIDTTTTKAIKLEET